MVYLHQYISEIFAGFATILSAASIWRSEVTARELKLQNTASRRMNMLIEIEHKNSCVGELVLIIVQKILLLQQHPELINKPHHEIARLKNNLNRLQEFKDAEKKLIQLAESSSANDIELNAKTLTDIKRIRIRIESDIKKETSSYEELKEDVNKANA